MRGRNQTEAQLSCLMIVPAVENHLRQPTIRQCGTPEVDDFVHEPHRSVGIDSLKLVFPWRENPHIFPRFPVDISIVDYDVIAPGQLKPFVREGVLESHHPLFRWDNSNSNRARSTRVVT